MGKHPQCSQGPLTYMNDCVIPTDYFSYLLAADPVTSTTKNCSELGYEFVSPDPVFSKFDVYWKGGAAGFSAWAAKFSVGHPELIKFLSAARDKQPACGDKSPAHTTSITSHTLHTYRALSKYPTGAIMTAYDASGALPQCAEGPATYMANCTFPNDMVAYLLSGKPVLLPGSQCTSMGYELVAKDNIYPAVTLYWKKNHVPSLPQFFERFFANHSNTFRMLNYTRDHTTACTIGA